jgi:hypothetical protein
LQLAQDAVSAAQRKFEQASETAEIAEATLREATERSSKLTALAAQALELLGPACPVCGQDIAEHDVRDRLQHRIDSAADDEVSLSMASAEVARKRLMDSQRELAQARQRLEPLRVAEEQARQLRQEQSLWLDRCASFETPVEAPLVLGSESDIRSGDMTSVEATLTALRVVWTAAGDLAAVLRTDVTDSRLAELRAEHLRAAKAVDALKEAVRLASAQEEQGKVLQRATTRAVTAVTAKRFRRLAPTVQDIYGRLDPHPSFKTLDFDLDVYRQRGIASPVARDETEDVNADPLLVFSSSQANVTALSYFLALGWAAGPDALPFVLLDDPLQSMDDVNVLGFSDLCRHIRRQRQLLVSTHERRLASLLQRKLAPRLPGETTRVVEFTAWTRSGPEIDQTLVESQLHEGELRSVVALGA